MIDLSLSEEQVLLEDTAARFARGQLRPAQRDHESAGAVAPTVAQAFDETGLSEVGRPGSGTGVLDRSVVVEALAWGDAGAALALTGPALSRSAAEALGCNEPVGFAHPVDTLDPESPVSLAWIPATPGAAVLVFDRAGRWTVGTPDLVPVRSLGLHAAGAARGTMPVGGYTTASPEAAALATALLHAAGAAMLAGVARASLEYATGYVVERRAFGKPLAQHQGLAFLVAEMAYRVEAAGLLARAAALSLDGGETGPAAGAWLEATEASCWVTDQGVQLLGGHGYMRAHPVEKWMRDARALSLMWGGQDLALDVDASWT